MTAPPFSRQPDFDELCPPPGAFLDGNGPGCQCGDECEFPCWQRAGLTDQPCCAGCVPLEAA